MHFSISLYLSIYLSSGLALCCCCVVVVADVVAFFLLLLLLLLLLLGRCLLPHLLFLLSPSYGIMVFVVVVT